eukprot:COSAG06_NODE_14672_length_1136_cov_2.061716_1_plen_46_part_10
MSKNGLFAPLTYTNRSFNQDRLGTDIGKALKKRDRFSYRGRGGGGG